MTTANARTSANLNPRLSGCRAIFSPSWQDQIAKPHFRGRNQERCVNYFTLAALVSLIVTLLLHPSRRGKRSSRSTATSLRYAADSTNTAESLAPMIALRHALALNLLFTARSGTTRTIARTMAKSFSARFRQWTYSHHLA